MQHHFKALKEASTVKNTDNCETKKLTKSVGNFENKQPNCTILFIFVFDCLLMTAFCPKSKVSINYGQHSNQNWWPPTKNLFSSKCPRLFVGLLSKTNVIFYRVQLLDWVCISPLVGQRLKKHWTPLHCQN